MNNLIKYFVASRMLRKLLVRFQRGLGENTLRMCVIILPNLGGKASVSDSRSYGRNRFWIADIEDRSKEVA